MIRCPDCGAENDESARFCDNCGRRLDDVAAPTATGTSTTASGPAPEPAAAPEPVVTGAAIADDGLPVGRDLDGIPGGERIIWEGRPSRLWSPRMALMNRYKLTNQRLIFEFGFVGKTTEEIELYRVTDVGVKQHPLERITGMGDIYLASGDTSTPTKYLHNVPDPQRIKDLIREATRQERERRRVMLREDF
jgi:hypothetical protein